MKILKIFALLLPALAGCDHWPGPNLKNDFGNEIKVSIEYGDGTRSSPVLPPCRVIGIGPNEVGRFGMVAKDVSIDRIVVESEGQVFFDLDRATISEMIEREKKVQYPYWALARDGIRFSYSHECTTEATGIPEVRPEKEGDHK